MIAIRRYSACGVMIVTVYDKKNKIHTVLYVVASSALLDLWTDDIFRIDRDHIYLMVSRRCAGSVFVCRYFLYLQKPRALRYTVKHYLQLHRIDCAQRIS